MPDLNGSIDVNRYWKAMLVLASIFLFASLTMDIRVVSSEFVMRASFVTMLFGIVTWMASDNLASLYALKKVNKKKTAYLMVAAQIAVFVIWLASLAILWMA